MAHANLERLREEAAREKEMLSKQFEQRIKGMRLDREQVCIPPPTPPPHTTLASPCRHGVRASAASPRTLAMRRRRWTSRCSSASRRNLPS
jgi:hypothetical protein